jgi:hypothetical protein
VSMGGTTTAGTTALQAADALFSAEESIKRAGRMVEDLHESIVSALHVLDDAELDSAKSRLTDRSDFYPEAAAEHLGRLQSRCRDLPDLAGELDAHLARAHHATEDAGKLLSELATADPEVGNEVALLRPRVAALGEMVDLARPMAMLATQHVEAANRASLDVTPPAMLEPQTLERSIRSAGKELGRADEDVRLLENVVDRAAATARQSAGVANEISDNATRRMASQQRDSLAGAGDGRGVQPPAQRAR